MKFVRILIYIICTTALLTVGVNTAVAMSANNNVPFIDISYSFVKKQIADLYRNNIISGTGGRKFEPKKTVTRAEFMAMAIRILRLQPATNDIPSFTDVARNSWYYGDVQAASNLRLAQGKDAQRFVPLDKITRQETAVIIMRMLKQRDDGQGSGSVSFKDMADIASWAAADVRMISNLGLMNGNDGSFNRLQGINIDLEYVQPSDRTHLTALIEELASELHRQKAILSVNVSPDLGTSWTAAFDFKALGEHADFIVLMGYDEHWAGAPTAGSVSSLPWLERAADKLLTFVPRQKIIMALPFYSREWANMS